MNIRRHIPLLNSVAMVLSIVGLVIVIILALVNVPASVEIPLALLDLCVLYPVVFAVIGWLVVTNGKVFGTWPMWLLTIGAVFGFSVPASNPIVYGLLSTLMPFAAWVMLLATVLLIWRSDNGLRIAALVAVAAIWGLVIGWRIQGDLLNAYLRVLFNQDPLSVIWWLSPLWCIVFTVLPLGVIGWSLRSAKLLWDELAA